MRPEVLFPLFSPTTALPGIGPRMAPLIARVAGDKVVDLLWHLPTGIIDRRYQPSLADAEVDRIATLTVTIEKHEPGPTRRHPYRILCADETGYLTLVFFHLRAEYLNKTYPEGSQRVVSGRVEEYRGGKQMTHPDHAGPVGDLNKIARVEPVYSLTSGLTLKTIAKAAANAVQRAPKLDEWIDKNLITDQAWPDWQSAVRFAHNPTDERALEADAPMRKRLAYDELLATQLVLQILRRTQRRLKGRAFSGDGGLRKKAVSALPFTLTGAQIQALKEIGSDMQGPTRMLRLLQGDVGSGKTIVAFMAMLHAVETGAQAAVMAPTEILARQHFATIEPLARAIGVEVVLLTGRDRGKLRDEKCASLAEGRTAIAIGTHALISEDVQFHDLGLVVVDEQHRFGVHQRAALTAKGTTPDTLLMTATPIPRTLMLAAYGDIDASKLTEKPPGRKPVDTRALPLDRLQDVIPAVQRAIASGAQIFWVCPLVEESENSDMAAATERYEALSKIFGSKVVLAHGQMKAAEKDAAMSRFSEGDADILVATTVIEVGVDVPQASVMVIEHAERFGLAQLHQLRGRIGRGTEKSTCLLLYGAPLGETARARIDILRQTDDGFRIAEEDLRLRGAGELLGTRQSGLPEFRLVSLPAHIDLLQMAADDAKLALERDPELSSERGMALRTLLYLFERDEGVRNLRGG